jgi:hypothetical protein
VPEHRCYIACQTSLKSTNCGFTSSALRFLPKRQVALVTDC